MRQGYAERVARTVLDVQFEPMPNARLCTLEQRRTISGSRGNRSFADASPSPYQSSRCVFLSMKTHRMLASGPYQRMRKAIAPSNLSRDGSRAFEA
eukprot:scaffold214072_cov36-Tisochrysis_lutea.AAC.4